MVQEQVSDWNEITTEKKAAHCQGFRKHDLCLLYVFDGAREQKAGRVPWTAHRSPGSNVGGLTR